MLCLATKAKLWMDGSGRVTVTLAMENQPGKISYSNVLIFPEDLEAGVVARMLEVTKGMDVDLELAVKSVVQAANMARSCPRSQAKLKKSIAQAEKGAEKSRAALMERILKKKEEAFRLAVQDLMTRGLSMEDIHDLVQDAIVQGVHDG